jgi:hypothetical protein
MAVCEILKADSKIISKLERFLADNESIGADDWKDVPRYHSAFAKGVKILTKDIMRSDGFLNEALETKDVATAIDIILKRIGHIIFEILDPSFVALAYGSLGAFYADNADPSNRDIVKLKLIVEYWDAHAGQLDRIIMLRPVYGALLLHEFITITGERFKVDEARPFLPE